jgi:hypothetical protein
VQESVKLKPDNVFYFNNLITASDRG